MRDKIKAILFDLDGVLVDACDWHYEALNQALASNGYPGIPHSVHMERFNGLPTRTKLKMLGITGSDAERVKRVKQEKTVDVIRDKCRRDVYKARLLTRLRKHDYKIGCVTNSVRETVELALKKLGMRKHFDVVISNEDVREPKPSPVGYLKAMHDLNVRPEQTVIVEDSPKGLEAAKASLATVIEVKNAQDVTEELFEGILL